VRARHREHVEYAIQLVLADRVRDVAALDHDWSALKIVWRRENR